MGYVEKNLQKGEEIVYKAKIHWAVYLRSASWALAAICLLVLSMGDHDYKLYTLIAAAALGIMALYHCARATLYVLSTENVLTTKRLIIKTGIISRSTDEMVLAKCEGLSVEQSILGRILGYGTVIATTGEPDTIIEMISNPVEFRNKISEVIDRINEKRFSSGKEE